MDELERIISKYLSKDGIGITYSKFNKEEVNKLFQNMKSYEKPDILSIYDNKFEHNSFEIAKENSSLEYQIKQKDNEISDLKSELSTKAKLIGNLQAEKEKIKNELEKFKGFWCRLMKHFQSKIGFDKDEKYKYVSDDLYKNGIFDDNDNEIANNIYRKVKPKEEIRDKNKKKNNFELK